MQRYIHEFTRNPATYLFQLAFITLLSVHQSGCQDRHPEAAVSVTLEVPVGTPLYDGKNMEYLYKGTPGSECNAYDCEDPSDNLSAVCIESGHKMVRYGCCGELCTGKIDTSKIIKNSLDQ